MNDEKSDRRDEQTPAGNAGRKPYEVPTLRVYGDVAELTRINSNIGNADGGSGQKKKTG